MRGFEPRTSYSRSRRATKLRYIPTDEQTGRDARCGVAGVTVSTGPYLVKETMLGAVILYTQTDSAVQWVTRADSTSRFVKRAMG